METTSEYSGRESAPPLSPSSHTTIANSDNNNSSNKDIFTLDQELPSTGSGAAPLVDGNVSTDSVYKDVSVTSNTTTPLSPYSGVGTDYGKAYNEVVPMKGLRSLADPISIPLERRLGYQEESITYNVYVGGLGEEVDENDLFHYFSPCGPIDSCRVFRSKDEPFHKFAHPSLCPDVGYGFVHFITPEGQAKALSKEFNRPKIKNSCGYTKIAVEKTTLFVGGLPISMKENDVMEMFRNAYISFRSIILKTGPPPNCTSRGFCFLTFDTHKAAEAARQILQGGPVHGKMLTVGWAEPQNNEESEDEDEMDRVTTLFVNNLASHIIDEQLKALFSPYGEILKCRVVRHLQTLESRGFGFVEYAEREACLAALSKLHGTDFFGEKLTVTLARPLDYRNRIGPTSMSVSKGFPPPSPAARGRGAKDKFYPHPVYPPFYPYPPMYPPPAYRYHPYSRSSYHPYEHHGYDYSYYAGHYDSYGYAGYYDPNYSGYYYGDNSKAADATSSERSAALSPQSQGQGQTQQSPTQPRSDDSARTAGRTADEHPAQGAGYNYSGYYGDAHYWQYPHNYSQAGYAYTNPTPAHAYGAYPGNYHYPEHGASSVNDSSSSAASSATPAPVTAENHSASNKEAPKDTATAPPTEPSSIPSPIIPVVQNVTPTPASDTPITLAPASNIPSVDTLISQQVQVPSHPIPKQQAITRLPPPPPPRRVTLPPPPAKLPAQN